MLQKFQKGCKLFDFWREAVLLSEIYHTSSFSNAWTKNNFTNLKYVSSTISLFVLWFIFYNDTWCQKKNWICFFVIVWMYMHLMNNN